MKGLILNLGFKSVRAIIFDSNGKTISSAFQRVQTFLHDKSVEQDSNEWWRKGLVCIKKVLNKERDIDFITVTASAACIIPVDREANPLMNTILVSDKRAYKEAEDISQLNSFKKLSFKTSAYYTIPRILWIKRNRPDIYERTYKFLSPNDFFIAKMSGDFVIDELNATKYHAFDTEYPHRLLQELNIDEDKLPDITPIGYKTETSDSFERESKLPKKVPVVVTTYDAICAFFGTGVQGEGEASDISGTVTSLRVLTKKNLREDESRVFELKYNDWNIVGGSNNLGGGLIEWLLCNLYTECKHEDLEGLSDRFAAKTGLIFLPYLLGERAPLWDNDVRGCFLGIERYHDKHDLARAVLESTGFILRSLIDVFEENGISITRLYAAGGLSRIDLVNQIKADITERRIYKVKEMESTALGAYYLARKSLEQEFDSSNLFDVEKVFVPEEKRGKTYSETYSLFKEAYSSLTDFHQTRTKLLSTDDVKSVNL